MSVYRIDTANVPAPGYRAPLRRVRYEPAPVGFTSGKAVLEHYKALAAKRAVQPVVKLTALAVTTPKEEAPALMSAAERQFIKSAVITAVSRAVNRDARDILSMRREPVLVNARHTMMWMLIRQTRTKVAMSYPETGRILGNRDHSGVMFGVKKVEAVPATYQPIVDRACEILGWPRMVIGG